MKRLPIFLYLHLAFALVAGAQSSPTAAAKIPSKKTSEKAAAKSASDDSESSSKLASDPETEANIAKAVGCLLERFHYSQHDFDDEISGKFLDRYFENLDGLHLHFLQSDIDEFSSLRTSLDDLTMRGKDTSPAHKIFDRFVQRVEQRVAFAEDLLKTEKFEFKGNDRYLVNRKTAPRPKNLEEAKALWQQHLRFEYLQEKLSRREKPNKKVTLPKSDNTKKLTPHEEIVKTLTSRYNRLHKTLKDLGPDEVLELYLTALSHVYDPHSDYMGRAQLENFAISMKLSLSGIGAILMTGEDDYCKIHELKEGPAQKSKQIKAGDRIVAVAQDGKEPVDCVGMKLNKVVEMIRGPKGTKVQLTILPVDASDPSVRKTVVLVRDDIKLEDQEAKAKVIDMPAANGKMIRVGVLDLPSFYEDMDGNRLADHKSTSADIRKLLKKLNEEKVSGIILDLRRNGGGALSEAIKLTGLFIKDGPVVQTKDPNGRIEVKSDRDSSIAYNGPLIVLTSRFSASASEILAGALQDYGRALVVGDSSTHGKGTVQQLLALDPAQLERLDCLSKKAKFGYDPGALKFTIQKFYRAGGSSTQLKGVVPDLVLPSINNYAEIGESALENPLPWDEVSSAKFEKLNRVEPYVTELKKRSTKRIETDKDFSYIREDIERFKKTLADKTVSLNEQARVKEMDELKAAQESRKKERQSRKPSEQTTYEVTLRNFDKSGLTLAVAKTNETSLAESSLLPGETDEDEKAPAVDATLEETKRILADYIALLGKETPVTVAK